MVREVTTVGYDSEVIEAIEGALKAGGRLHTFLSSCAIRVVRIEKNGKLIGYGEHAYTREALRIAAENVAGRGKEETLYATGSLAPDDPLDAWVQQGHTFDAYFHDGKFVFELRGMEEAERPEELIDAARKGQTVSWTDARGVTWEASPIRMANGSRGCSIRTLKMPEGMAYNRACYWWAIRKAARGSLMEAIGAAFIAPREEEREKKLLAPSKELQEADPGR